MGQVKKMQEPGTENFTTEELRSIMAMAQEKAAHIAVEAHYNAKKLESDATYQKYLSITRKAYVELIDRDFRGLGV